MCTAALFPEASWKVLDTGNGGNHYLSVETCLNLTRANREVRYIYNRKRIHEEISQLDNTTIRRVEDLIDNVKRISEKHKKKDVRKPKFWWSEDVDIAWKEKSEARKNFNNTSSEVNLIEFKRKAAIFQRKKRQEILKKLQEFPEEVTPFTDRKTT
ncbi:uncharacterized protein LOC134225513 [Armigeres subalbatus]|uniref:uncharacterized protein LOC134225513 n=1 Tax=Armigeres subalbatus TaxID=124917 RepID=UPI002ED249D0